jgi:hypothetical protein
MLPASPPSPLRLPIDRGVTEYIVSRYVQATAKGMSRQHVINVLPGSNLQTVLWRAGAGRYRVEARDRRRQVVKVYVYDVFPDGHIARARPMKRPPKLPPPQFVA